MANASCTVYIVANPTKRAATRAFDELCAFVRPRCTLVGADLTQDFRGAAQAGAQRIVVIGGDGTLIGVARSLGATQVPLIGVNVGKLGFLAEFSLEEIKSVFDRALNDASLISRRSLLHVSMDAGEGAGSSALSGSTPKDRANMTGLAVNDCVIQAGPPYRIIDLGVSIDGEHLTDVGGDGLIVCTPSGSTAHNLSAGGPIMQPDVDAIILTPLNPHSLTHKPIVIHRESVIDIQCVRVNEGTTAIIDGQVPHPLSSGDRVTIRRFSHDLLLVKNPLYPSWHKLKTKLHWGRSPSFE